jgi:hypothetical protein
MNVIKTIGENGQIFLGKEHAGKSALIDEIEPGVWVVKIGQFIPDSERWLHEPDTIAKLDEAIAWAEATLPSDNLAEIEAAVNGRWHHTHRPEKSGVSTRPVGFEQTGTDCPVVDVEKDSVNDLAAGLCRCRVEMGDHSFPAGTEWATFVQLPNRSGLPGCGLSRGTVAQIAEFASQSRFCLPF